MGNFLTGSKKEKKPSMKKKKSVLDDDTTYFSSYRHNDLEQYRRGYPGKKDHKDQNDNLKFYKNEIKSYPDGDYIENIHKDWWGDYERLERHHGYIQWLFPIRESGMNFHAQELQCHEVNGIMDDPKAFERVLKSYQLMLDFYGMELDPNTGRITRANNWKSRFQHLNRSYHNYLRITRILKFLGEFGHENYKRPFVEFVLEEAMEHGTLINTLESCVRYWLETIKSKEDREALKDYVRKIESGYNSPDVEADDLELVSGRKVDKMIEKSKENQKEFSKKNGSEEDLDEASNAEWRKKEEEMKKNSQKEETKKSESEDFELEKNNTDMDTGSGGTGAKLARSDKEKKDAERLLKDEEERMSALNTEKETAMEEGKDTSMEVDNTETRNPLEMDTICPTAVNPSDSQQTVENPPSPV